MADKAESAFDAGHPSDVRPAFGALTSLGTGTYPSSRPRITCRPRTSGTAMSTYHAEIVWHRNEQSFTDNRYSRAHEWRFDGGVTVPASSSAHVVPLPWSVEDAVDPEEAFVASLSSCHMLWFLSLAAARGLRVVSC